MISKVVVAMMLMLMNLNNDITTTVKINLHINIIAGMHFLVAIFNLLLLGRWHSDVPRDE